jgi:hypothetical protein
LARSLFAAKKPCVGEKRSWHCDDLSSDSTDHTTPPSTRHEAECGFTALFLFDASVLATNACAPCSDAPHWP